MALINVNRETRKSNGRNLIYVETEWHEGKPRVRAIDAESLSGTYLYPLEVWEHMPVGDTRRPGKPLPPPVPRPPGVPPRRPRL